MPKNTSPNVSAMVPWRTADTARSIRSEVMAGSVSRRSCFRAGVENRASFLDVFGADNHFVADTRPREVSALPAAAVGAAHHVDARGFESTCRQIGFLRRIEC